MHDCHLDSPNQNLIGNTMVCIKSDLEQSHKVHSVVRVRWRTLINTSSSLEHSHGDQCCGHEDGVCAVNSVTRLCVKTLGSGVYILPCDGDYTVADPWVMLSLERRTK